jgi:hypothetical protein
MEMDRSESGTRSARVHAIDITYLCCNEAGDERPTCQWNFTIWIASMAAERDECD